MYKKISLLGLLSLCLLFSFTQKADANSKNRPNVVYIYASDLGKGLLSAYGQKHFTTPNIDALINNGVSFNKAYGSSVTAYARASLHTGYFDCSLDKWNIRKGGMYVKGSGDVEQIENFIASEIKYLDSDDLYLP